MAALCGEEDTWRSCRLEFWGSSDDDQQLEAELVKRAGELFAHGNKAPASTMHRRGSTICIGR
jgi:hypothetical protein